MLDRRPRLTRPQRPHRRPGAGARLRPAAAVALAVVAGAGCDPLGVTELRPLRDPQTDPPPIVRVTPNPVTFPTVLSACGLAEAAVEIRNDTDGSVRVSRGMVEGDAFEVDWPAPLPAGGVAVRAGGRLRLPLRFVPSGTGTFEGELSFDLDFGPPTRRTVQLRGRAVDDLTASDTFQQITSLNTDVIFIVDNSASMRAEQRGLRESFRSFVQSADDGFTDYRVAVTTTDLVRESGRFVPVSQGEDFDGDGVPDDLDGDGDADEIDLILERQQTPDRSVDRLSEPTPESRFRRLADVGVAGAETEQGLEAARLALTPSRREAANFGFFRDDALLSLIFVSDERDQSLRSVDEYVSAYRQLAPSGRVRASAVVGLPPDGCDGEGGSATAAPRYVEVARRLGGGTASICTEDWGETLERISGLAFGLLRRFQLSGFALETPRVFIDGRERPPVFDTGQRNWSYDPDRRTVEFVVEQTPPLGSEIRIDYELGCSP